VPTYARVNVTVLGAPFMLKYIQEGTVPITVSTTLFPSGSTVTGKAYVYVAPI